MTPHPGSPHPGPSSVFADYFDGKTAVSHRVRLVWNRVRHQLEITLPGQTDPIVWLLAEVRRLPDQASRNTVLLAHAKGGPARLLVRDISIVRQMQTTCRALEPQENMTHIWRRLIFVASGAVASVLSIVFLLVPLLANQLAGVLPSAGEQALGDATYQQIRQALGSQNGPGIKECHTTRGDSALEHLMWRLQRGQAGKFRIKLHVLDHPMVNAFALPGGHIVLFHGLLDQAKSPEELAGVIGHEMGHVAHRDPTRLALRSAGSVGVLGLLLGDFAGGAAVLYLSEQLISANYSRAAEAAADSYSIKLLNEQRIPTLPLADFFLRLSQRSGPLNGLMSHLASHPDLKGRAEKTRRANQDKMGFWPVLGPSEWRDVKEVCDR